MKVKVSAERILAIDAFRGLTIFAMIFVNELAGVAGIPGWMKHAAADEDAMTFVDVVFPAFLFIVGMSIPFSVQRRLSGGQSPMKVMTHSLWRAGALIVMGVFMVNAEGGYDEPAMGMSIHVWSLLFYLGAVLVWVDWRLKRQPLVNAIRALGVILLIVLAFVYRDEEGGFISPQWWGILGLIGWAYLVSLFIYLATGGNRLAILSTIAICMGYYVVGHYAFRGNPFYHTMLFSQGGHAIHTSIVLSGVMLSLIFFHTDLLLSNRERLMRAALLAVVMTVVGFSLRPMFGISKIYSTPAWAALCVTCCIVVFAAIHLLVRARKVTSLGWLAPAASNPLLAYIIPFITYAAMQAMEISFPSFLYRGLPGIAWCLVYASLVMLLGGWLTRRGLVIKL